MLNAHFIPLQGKDGSRNRGAKLSPPGWFPQLGWLPGPTSWYLPLFNPSPSQQCNSYWHLHAQWWIFSFEALILTSPSLHARKRGEAEVIWPAKPPQQCRVWLAIQPRAPGSCLAHQQPGPSERQNDCLTEGRNGQTRRFRLTQGTDKLHSLTLPL